MITSKHIKDSLQMFRKTGMRSAEVCVIEKGNKEYIRKAVIKYTKWALGALETDEFLTLRIEDEDTFNEYTFWTTTDDIKELLNVHNTFLETGVFIHLD
jgi:hypothetical protein